MSDEARNFVAPIPDDTQFVRWYATGDPDRGGPADVALICRVDKRMVSLVVMTGNHRGKRFDSVRHISDPKLTINSDHRIDGAWDFTLADIRLNEWKAGIERQLAGLRMNIGRKNARDAKEELVHQE